MGRRTGLAESGSAYSGSPSVAWGYNSRGEVTLHDHTTAAYDSVYEFDTIGNRTKAAGGTSLPGTDNHMVNSRNQYTNIVGVNPGYDDDGNLTSDAGGNTHGSARTYQWDAENQLRQVSSGAVAAYRYDPYGRRISKTAGGVTTWFIYEGWNLVAEYQSGTLTRTHLWGLDLSGTTQGAGGVGGLLCTSIGGTKYYPLYDGNGNICQYLDSSGGLAAHYEYGPFGHLLNTPGTGSSPTLFNFRFSTKFNDYETDFYYYGYRYYSTWMARWLNRDPLEEAGGEGLYCFLGNSSINFFDSLGKERYVLNVANTNEQTGTTHFGADNLGQLKRQMAKKCGDKDCVSELRLGHHGNKEGFNLSGYLENGKYNSSGAVFKGDEMNRVRQSNAKEFGEQLKNNGKLCKVCIIWLLSCEVGLSGITDALAAGSGCTVYSTKVCVRPNYTVPLESTISKGPDTGNKAPWDKAFPPKKP
jgi:RHS repeat-associated protein